MLKIVKEDFNYDNDDNLDLEQEGTHFVVVVNGKCVANYFDPDLGPDDTVDYSKPFNDACSELEKYKSGILLSLYSDEDGDNQGFEIVCRKYPNDEEIDYDFYDEDFFDSIKEAWDYFINNLD